MFLYCSSCPIRLICGIPTINLESVTVAEQSVDDIDGNTLAIQEAGIQAAVDDIDVDDERFKRCPIVKLMRVNTALGQ